MANKVGGKIPLMGGLLNAITPKPDKAQTIDLCLKLVVELVAFAKLTAFLVIVLGILWRLWASIVVKI